MASFDPFLPTLLRFEGGYVDGPAAPGGVANKGVSLQTFRAFGRQLLAVDPTLDRLKSLTDAQAGILHKTLYWDRLRADEISLQPLAEILVDFYIHAGAHAVKLLQRVLNDLGAQPLLSVDGLMGADTSRALQPMDLVQVYRRYRQGRSAHYQDLVQQRPGLQRFLEGWLARVAAFPDL
jgi:lysozyme family protein